MKNAELAVLLGFKAFTVANIKAYLDPIAVEQNLQLGFKEIMLGPVVPALAKKGFPIMGMVPFEGARAGDEPAGTLQVDVGMVFQDTDPQRLVMLQMSHMTALLNMIEDNHRLATVPVMLAESGKVEYYARAPNQPNAQNMNAASVRVSIIFQTDR